MVKPTARLLLVLEPRRYAPNVLRTIPGLTPGAQAFEPALTNSNLAAKKCVDAFLAAPRDAVVN